MNSIKRAKPLLVENGWHSFSLTKGKMNNE